MSCQTEFSSDNPAGEAVRRLMFAVICLGSVAVAVVFSPALGLIR